MLRAEEWDCLVPVLDPNRANDLDGIVIVSKLVASWVQAQVVARRIFVLRPVAQRQARHSRLVTHLVVFEIGISPSQLVEDITGEILEPVLWQRCELLSSLISFRMKVVTDR